MPMYLRASTVVPSFYDIATAPPITYTSSSASPLSSFFVAVTDKGPVYVSSNAGASFQLSTALSAKLRGVTIGANGTCIHTYLYILIRLCIYTYMFVGVGIAVGSRNVSSFGPVIYRSTNASAYSTWQTTTLSNPVGLTYPTATQLWGVKTYNGQTAIAVGSYSTIFRSQDQGRLALLPSLYYMVVVEMSVCMYVCMAVCLCIYAGRGCTMAMGRPCAGRRPETYSTECPSQKPIQMG